ncbi:MAG: hypothetical protein FI725_05805 [SAR202 cluster bacterium]|nr:hypothetical protein [SAR202 cluster bacterium]|tara:strand:- start:857 stop:1213 length:357 start_codon:yes stop_codon:yes gene_type:complete
MDSNNTYDHHKLKDIIDTAENLEENIRGLHDQLLITLSSMDDLRHKGTAMQRSLLQTKNLSEETNAMIKELGRIMRGFQEQGRLFETVAEPLVLVDTNIAAKLEQSANDLSKLTNQKY